MLDKKNKKNLIERFKKKPEDTGSTSVQIALLSERIKYLTEHLKKNQKDFHSRRGLLMLVGRRRKLLTYLKDKDPQGYGEIIKELDLKK